MKPRIDFLKVAYPVVEAMLSLEKYLHQSVIEEPLRNLVYLRASQFNGCAYCIDMHWKDLRAAGETEQRLYGLEHGRSLRITRNASVQHWLGRRR